MTPWLPLAQPQPVGASLSIFQESTTLSRECKQKKLKKMKLHQHIRPLQLPFRLSLPPPLPSPIRTSQARAAQCELGQEVAETLETTGDTAQQDPGCKISCTKLSVICKFPSFLLHFNTLFFHKEIVPNLEDQGHVFCLERSDQIHSN